MIVIIFSLKEAQLNYLHFGTLLDSPRHNLGFDFLQGIALGRCATSKYCLNLPKINWDFVVVDWISILLSKVEHCKRLIFWTTVGYTGDPRLML